MSIHYRSKDGDTLDAICWRYYIQQASLGEAAMMNDPRMLGSATLDNSILLNPQTDSSLCGVVEQVLAANPSTPQVSPSRDGVHLDIGSLFCRFSGTSAASAIAGGLIALALQTKGSATVNFMPNKEFLKITDL